MEISLFTRSIMGIKFVLPEMCSTAALGCDPLSDQNAANAQPDCTPRVGVILNPRTKDRLEIIRGIRAGEGSAPLPSRGSQPCCLISLESRALSGERSHRSCSCTAALGSGCCQCSTRLHSTRGCHPEPAHKKPFRKNPRHSRGRRIGSAAVSRKPTILPYLSWIASTVRRKEQSTL